MLDNHKKGMSGPSTLGKFIIVFILVFVLITLFNKTMKGSTKIMECTTNGGECVAGTCQWGKQIPALGDKAAGCKTGEICCINITQAEATPDPECVNKTFGTYCTKDGDIVNKRACDRANKCVTLCEFCSKNAQTLTPAMQRMCTVNGPTSGDISKFAKGGYSCSCTNQQCLSLTRNASTRDNCISNYCPTRTPTTASDYACCIPP